MLRIGEAAKAFDISNRTLRYWEESGILKSARTENGYRYYDEESAARIRQIAMLRKLRMPIAQIERIFIEYDLNAAIDALTRHLTNLRRDADDLSALARVTGELIERIRGAGNLHQVFTLVETRAVLALTGQDGAPQNELSERKRTMGANQELTNVRIVRIPAMMVASYRAESETPERDCGAVMDKLINDNQLHKWSGFRHFGFNNPSPSEGNPVYGYEMWAAVPENFATPAPIVVKRFDGGLYASIATRMNEIGERWQALYRWVQASGQYEMDWSHQWLEECVDYETFSKGDESMKQLDLLEPIRVKEKIE